MTVYLDTAFALNGAVNYLMLLSAARLAGAPLRRWRLGLAAGLGGLYAAAVFVPGLAVLRAAGMKLLMLTVMALTAFGAHRRTVRLALLFAAVSAALAGAAMLAVQVFRVGALLLPGGIFYPLRARGILLLAALCCMLCQLVFSRVTAHSGRLVPVTIRAGGRSLSLTALRDTGNTLRDPMTNEPVLVTDWRAAARLFPEAALRQEELLHPAELLPALHARWPELRFRLMPYCAVGTAGSLLLTVRCTVAEAGARAQQRLVAFSPTPLSEDGSFNALTGGV